jgi:hypothetical protein
VWTLDLFPFFNASATAIRYPFDVIVAPEVASKFGLNIGEHHDSYSVVNALGRQVIRGTAGNINASDKDLTPGIYFLRHKSDRNRVAKQYITRR